MVLYWLISGLWQIAEIIIYRKTIPRVLDDIVAVILAISIYFNLN
jgi:hypothetical protein